jgi:hypothetical protein
MSEPGSDGGAARGPVSLGGSGWLPRGRRAPDRFDAALPGGKRPRQGGRAPHLDRPTAQGVAPLELSEIPAGERHRIADHDHQILFPAGVLLADLSVAAFDQQPATAAGPDSVG